MENKQTTNKKRNHKKEAKTNKPAKIKNPNSNNNRKKKRDPTEEGGGLFINSGLMLNPYTCTRTWTDSDIAA